MGYDPNRTQRTRRTGLRGFDEAPPRFPLLGKVRLGKKEANQSGNGEHPVDLDHFKFDDETLEQYPQILEAYGPEPKAIKIVFPVDGDNLFDYGLRRWGKHGLKCAGDGDQATAFEDGGDVDIDCPCRHLKSEANPKGECNVQGSLDFMILDPTTPRRPLIWAGVFRLTTNSIRNLNRIRDGLRYVGFLYGGTAGVPILMSRVSVDCVDNIGGKKIKKTRALLQLEGIMPPAIGGERQIAGETRAHLLLRNEAPFGVDSGSADTDCAEPIEYKDEPTTDGQAKDGRHYGETAEIKNQEKPLDLESLGTATGGDDLPPTPPKPTQAPSQGAILTPGGDIAEEPAPMPVQPEIVDPGANPAPYPKAIEQLDGVEAHVASILMQCEGKARKMETHPDDVLDVVLRHFKLQRIEDLRPEDHDEAVGVVGRIGEAPPPTAPAEPWQRGKLASDNQKGLIKGIIRRNGWDEGEIMQKIMNQYGAGLDGISSRQASAVITWLKGE